MVIHKIDAQQDGVLTTWFEAITMTININVFFWF